MHNKNRFSVRYYFMTACLLLAAFVIGVGHAAWTTTFSVSGSETKKQEPVCYIKGTDRSKNRYFMSIEKALDTAKSGEQVNVIPGTNPTIKGKLVEGKYVAEVKSGVTLNIPPQEGSKYKGSLTFGTGSDPSVTMTLKRSLFGSEYTDYLTWSGEYSLTDKTYTFIRTAGIEGGKSQERNAKLLSLTFSSQLFEGINKNISKTIIAQFSGTYEDKPAQKAKYYYSYKVIFPTFSFINNQGDNIFLGGISFSWSGNGKQSDISASTINSFSPDNELAYAYEDVKNYSFTGQTNVSSLNKDSSSVVTIDDNVTLKNNGKIYIGGTLAGGSGGNNIVGGQYSGQTYGSYSTLRLGQNSVIESYGDIYVYGYLEEKTLNNSSKLYSHSGNIYAPFVVRDFRGGSATVSCYNSRESNYCFPFNQYEVRNITCEAYYYYNATLHGLANLYAGDQQNAAQMEIIGKLDSAFIQLTDSENSFVKSKFSETKDHLGFCDLQVFGGCKINSMSLSLSLAIFSKTVNSTDFCFPISFRYKISFLRNPKQQTTAVFDTLASKNRFQFLPGSTFVLGEGCELKAYEIVFYKEWDTKYKNYYASEETCKTQAYMINNGTCNVQKLAGLIKSEVSGAKLNISGDVNYTNYQIKGSKGTDSWKILFLRNDDNDYLTINNSLSFYSYNTSTNSFDTSLDEAIPKGEYSSISDANGVTGFKRK